MDAGGRAASGTGRRGGRAASGTSGQEKSGRSASSAESMDLFRASYRPPQKNLWVKVSLIEAVNRQGARLRSGLKELANRNPFIGDARGRGLFLGIEFVADKEAKKSIPPRISPCGSHKKAGFDHDLLLYTGSGTADGQERCHILFGPPFIATDAEIYEMLFQLSSMIEACLPIMEHFASERFFISPKL